MTIGVVVMTGAATGMGTTKDGTETGSTIAGAMIAGSGAMLTGLGEMTATREKRRARSAFFMFLGTKG